MTLPSTMLSFSVLICTFKRHLLLAQALDALVTKSTEKPDQIVVVNGGDEQADEVVKHAQATSTFEIVLVKTINKNLATSRNIGLHLCTGDIIAMTDDDARVFPDWVSRMKTLHGSHPEAGAVGGVVLGSNHEKLLARVADVTTFPQWTEERFVRTLPGVNISYKREAVLQIGPQDETLFRGEDVDFNWRLNSLGYRILFSPEVKVLHHHRPTIRGLVDQQYMYGRAYILVRRKHPDMYSVFPRGECTFTDFVRGLKFLMAVVYEPLAMLPCLRGVDKVTAFPLLAVFEIAWRWGMVRQSLLDHRG